MTTPTLDQFAIPGHVAPAEGAGGLPLLRIDNRHARADIYLHGAQVAAFQPHGGGAVLWLSEEAQFAPHRAIRGGIPICWPWFGPHPGDGGKPQHGFARLRSWRVTASAALPDGGTEVRLILADDGETRALWPHPFRLELRVAVGRALELALTCHNTGGEPFEAGAALHSYFAVAAIEGTAIEGLEGRAYLDQKTGETGTQRGAVRVTGEVDRIYADSGDTCIIDDPGHGRRIAVAKSGSRSTVVWNPWAGKAARMTDFPDDGYRRMVCVESANAAADVRRVAPGQSHTLTQRIALV